MANIAPDGPLETEKKGPLSAIGDPVGQIADKALRPVGAITGSVGKPAGEALLNVEDQAREEVGMKEKADGEKPGGERIGFKEQTAKNPAWIMIGNGEGGEVKKKNNNNK